MESDKKVTITINSLNTSNSEDCKKINLIKSICKYYNFECHVYVDDDLDEEDEDFCMSNIEIECCLNDVEKLVNIFKEFDIYIDAVDDCIYYY